MSQRHAQEVSETLDQMGLDEQGIKKGSRLIPVFTLVFTAIAFFVYALPPGDSQLDAVFDTACANVNAVASKTRIGAGAGAGAGAGNGAASTPNSAAPSTAPAGAAAPGAGGPATFPAQSKTSSFRSRCAGAGPNELSALANDYSKLDTDRRIGELFNFGLKEFGGFKAVKRAAASIAKTGIVWLFSDFKKVFWSVAITTGTLALYSFIPGLAGMIYRRSFWTWFLFAFVGLYAINASPFGPIVKAEDLGHSGVILVFLILQFVILLLAYRLRTYSSSVSKIPAKTYNIGVAAALMALAIACYMNWESWIGSTLGVSSGFFKWEFILIGLPLLYTLLRKSDLWDGSVRKNIVVCLDGTNNTPGQKERGRLAQTNVFKLFKMLKPDSPEGYIKSGVFDASIAKKYADKQIAFYYTGVGNKFDSSPIGQTLGQATGLGAADIVERAYLDIMRVYRPGDRVFIFGFSRGAAMARLLANVIGQRGAPKHVLTLKLFGRHWILWQSKPDKDHAAHVPITVLGCWDTVGAFGIAKTIAGINFQKIDLFTDLTVSENVEQAYHMLALDEQRDSFVPALMDPDPITPERIVEVWFSGDHANIGGGWATAKLSDVTLDFLLTHVSSGYARDAAMQPGDETWGLYLSAMNGDTIQEGNPGNPGNAGAAVIHPDPLGQLRQWSSALYSYAPRQLPLHAVISETVFQRMTRAIPVYAPQSLFDHNASLDKKRESVRLEVERLSKTNSLTPEERSSILEFKDKLRLMRWPKYWAELEALRAPKKPVTKLSNAAPVNSGVK